MVANIRYRSSVQFDKFWHMYTPRKSPPQSRVGLREYKILNRADPLRTEPLFPVAFQLSQTQASLAFKVIYSGCSSSWSRNPRLDNLIWGSEHFLLREALCNFNYPLFCKSPILGVWILNISYLCPSYPFCFGSSLFIFSYVKSFLLPFGLFS